MENEPNPSPENESGSNPGIPTNASEQKILELLADSLMDSNALLANVGVVNARLLSIANRFGSALDECLQEPLESMGEFDEMIPRVDSYLRITRQIDRFSQWLEKMKTT